MWNRHFAWVCVFNSLERFEWHLRWIIFKPVLVIDGWGMSCEIALRLMSLDLTDDKSTLVQVMAWCRQATSHYLSQCWPRSMSLGHNELTQKLQPCFFPGWIRCLCHQSSGVRWLPWWIPHPVSWGTGQGVQNLPQLLQNQGRNQVSFAEGKMVHRISSYQFSVVSN